MSELARQRIRVHGTVQGVGFRPFVYRAAVASGLAGWVGNDSRGVVAEVEGEGEALEALVRTVTTLPPPLAVVESWSVDDLEPTGEVGFTIAATVDGGGPDVRVSADIAPCRACSTEMADPHDRRHDYPFVNCTDCGPRYTIVLDVPYDRQSTTMAGFAMCRLCQAEYDDPADRRFHAQPNACPDCGPQVTWSTAGEAMAGPSALEAAAACLRAGGVVAVKGVGGYHLACDAANEAAVLALRLRKQREDKPFAVMVGDVASAESLCELGAAARDVLASARRPVVLAPRRAEAPVAGGVAPGMPELGVMLPSSPLHVLLLSAVGGRALVMTSGNRSDEPVVHDDLEARERLTGLVDGLLQHDRPIHVRADDSVVRSAPADRLQVLRRARGWVPQPLRLPVAAERPVLAVGAQLKSTVAVARGHSLVVSQHIGDLEHWSAYRAFTSTIEHLVRLSGAEPAIVAHDLHPDYGSTAWAAASALPTSAVQHHHAHVAACLVEHGVATPVLGVAFDGSGLGPDGTLWGGEFLRADLLGYQRLGHLAAMPLPGGDAAVREPWRAALALLDRCLGTDVAAEHGPRLDPRWPAVLSMLSSARTPQTSSAGRLFDAVAALLGLRSRVSYEGQAAVELEALARAVRDQQVPSYPFGRSTGRLDPAPMLAALLEDRRRGVPVEVVAAGFHRALADGAVGLAVDLAAAHALDTVVLSGGVFQNVLLSDRTECGLRAAGLRVLVHQQLPPNDGSISVGQAAVAAADLAHR